RAHRRIGAVRRGGHGVDGRPAVLRGGRRRRAVARPQRRRPAAPGLHARHARHPQARLPDALPGVGRAARRRGADARGPGPRAGGGAPPRLRPGLAARSLPLAMERGLGAEPLGAERIGLVAGSGRFPVLFAETARRRGVEVVAVAHLGETDPALERVVGAITWIHPGELDAMIRALRAAGIRRTVMVGGIAKPRLFRELRPDARAMRLLASLGKLRDDLVLRALAAELETEGIAVVESTLYLQEIVPRWWRSPRRRASRWSPSTRRRCCRDRPEAPGGGRRRRLPRTLPRREVCGPRRRRAGRGGRRRPRPRPGRRGGARRGGGDRP